MTECHFAIPGRNRCDVLSTWAAGVSYARILSNHQRHGDVLKIATAADFCGTRWQNNALMIPVPGGQSYLMPVARVMQLFRHHIGSHAVGLDQVPDALDVVASRRGQKLFLHVVNTHRTRSGAHPTQRRGQSHYGWTRLSDRGRPDGGNLSPQQLPSDENGGETIAPGWGVGFSGSVRLRRGGGFCLK